jgi:hypothetical protein
MATGHANLTSSDNVISRNKTLTEICLTPPSAISMESSALVTCHLGHNCRPHREPFLITGVRTELPLRCAVQGLRRVTSFTFRGYLSRYPQFP